MILKQKQEELQILDNTIAAAQDAVTLATEALDILTRTSLRAQVTLKLGSPSDMEVIAPYKHEITTIMLNPEELSERTLELCRELSLARATEKPDERNLEVSFVQLNPILQVVDDALRRQRLTVNVNTCSIKLYSLNRAVLQANLDEVKHEISVIKRIPDEIWYEILTVRISKQSHCWPQTTYAPLSIPALAYSHVCRSWRRVVFSSPSMWKAIHWNLRPDKEPNRNLIDLWLSKSPENERRIYERQSHSGLATAALTHMKLQLPIHSKLQYYIRQTRTSLPNHLDGDQVSVLSIPSLFVKASKCSSRILKLQTNLLHRFTVLESLNLQDVLPRSMLSLPSTIAHLVIVFTVPHRTYNLAQLLRPSLETLKISHFSISDTPGLRQTVTLPRLRKLDITPLEHSIANSLLLPALEKLFICPPKNGTASWPAEWLASLIPHCAKLKHMHFGWPWNTPDTTISSLDRLQVFFDLRLHTTRLRTLQFSSGFISGSTLADFLSTETRNKLEELTIDGCRGVSRMDCERLVELVGKLSITRSM